MSAKNPLFSKSVLLSAHVRYISSSALTFEYLYNRFAVNVVFQRLIKLPFEDNITVVLRALGDFEWNSLTLSKYLLYAFTLS